MQVEQYHHDANEGQDIGQDTDEPIGEHFVEGVDIAR